MMPRDESTLLSGLRGLLEAGRYQELLGQLDELPRDTRPHGTAAQADDVHVIVLDTLPRGEVIVNQRGPDSRYLVGADRRAHAAAAHSHAARDPAARDRLGKRHDVVRIVVVRAQLVGPEIDDFVSGGAEPGDQLFLQGESPVIGRDTYEHGVLSTKGRQRREGSIASRAAASRSANTTAAS